MQRNETKKSHSKPCPLEKKIAQENNVRAYKHKQAPKKQCIYFFTSYNS
jgi:hypothetical protein